jgi:hypothetical protein
LSEYIVIPHVAARHINLVQGNVSVSPHSLTTMSLFIHAMGLKLDDIHADAFAVIQHDAWLDADDMADFEGYASWQRRGSMLIDERDYNSKADGSPILSLQPVITGNLDFSLVLRYRDGAPAPQKVSQFLETARFQGGRIDGFGKVNDFDSESAARRYVRTGKWVMDRRDRLEGSMDPLRDMLSICALRERETVPEGAYPVMWSSATVGYALLSEPEVRDDFRCSDNGPVPSAFAEAMTGLVGLYSVHDARITKIPFWESGFVQKDVYLVRGQSFIEKEA